MTPSGFTHDRRGPATTDEWYTPPQVFDALELSFDLDPAAPPGGVPWPAEHHYTKATDGLRQPWSGRVWLNSPHGRQTGQWLTRLGEHGDGIALVFARTDTAWFHRATSWATALCFLRGRLRFWRPDGTESGNAAPSVLMAYGLPCAMAVAESGLGRTVILPRL